MDARSARDLLRERAGAELVERLEHLDRVFATRPSDEELSPPERGAATETDVVFLGGGLSLLVAAELARLGVGVVVLERARAGAAHREWNASRDELAPLVAAEIVSPSELEELVVARYREGICSFHGGAPRTVRGVLDHAIDAGPLLEHVRAKCVERGVRFIDLATVVGLGAGPSAVRVAWTANGARSELVAKLAVDARGASSPYAAGDLVCPTVGGVLGGLSFDPGIGDILVTTEGAEDGRQHVWEGFPGRPGELTVYLFHYSRRADLEGQGGALLPLYARFFSTLDRYKQGDPSLLRPTFGYIPGWSRLGPPPSSPSARIVLVGDAASRHSPLTFCGFGSMLRGFRPVAAGIARSVADGQAPSATLHAEEDVHAWTGLLARMMASGALRGGALNALLDDAFASLEEMGNESFAALLKDRMSAREFIGFLRRTARKHPAVYREVMKALGPTPMARWGLRLVRDAIASSARA